MSTSTEYMDGLNAPAERRFYPRVTPPTPIYVAFGSNNLGVLNNVSENGFQVSTPSELPLNSVYRVSLSLNGAPKTISVTVRTIWTVGAEKRSGIQLLDLSDEDRSRIRQWVEFEMSRSEKSTGWFSPKNGDDRPAGRETDQRNANQKKSVDRKAADREPFGWSNSSRNPMSREPVKEILYTPPDHATTERAEAPIPPAAVASVSDNATKDTPEATQPPRIILPRAGE